MKITFYLPIICLLASVCEATTIDFNYTGQDMLPNGTITAVGTGSMTFADGLTVLTEQDLTSFSFTLTDYSSTTCPQLCPSVFTASFSAPAQSTFGLTLDPTTNLPIGGGFNVGYPGGNNLTYWTAWQNGIDKSGSGILFYNATGTTVFTDPLNAPEPASMALFGIGLLAMSVFCRSSKLFKRL